jgi:tight adherence protein B
MDPTLLLIGLTVGGAVALLVVVAYQRIRYQGRVVSARLTRSTASPTFGAGSLLHRRRRLPVPLTEILPLSAEARERMGRELDQAGWPIRVGEYLSLRLACAAVAGAAGLAVLRLLNVEAAWLKILAVVVLVYAGWFVPRLYLSRKRQKRLEKIERQLPDALTAMAKSLRAGSGLLQGLAYAAGETPAPLGPELQAALRDLRLGAEAEDVFADLSQRIGSPDLDIALTAIVIQRTVGGNLSEILANVTNTIRERAKMKGEVRVLTSRQRLTGNLVALLPVLVAVVFIAINPDTGKLLVETAAGQISLAVGIAFELLGLWMIRRLAVIEI